MQYADVAVAIRAGHGNTRFTYAIPPALLAQVVLGGVVEVPYRNRLRAGIIEQFRRQLPADVNTEKLRPIRRVLTNWPLFDVTERTLRTRLALETAAPAALTLVQLLPPRSLYAKSEPPSAEQRFTRGERRFVRSNQLTNDTDHLPAIRRTIDTGHTVLIVTPTKETAMLWLMALAPQFAANQLLPFWSGLSAPQSRRAWQAALQGEPTVVIGTRSTSLLPFRRLGLMLVDQPSHPQSREEQTPHYSSLQVGILRNELFGTQLIVWDTLPPLALLPRTEQVRWRFGSESAPLPKIHIISRTGGTSLAPTTEAAMNQTLRRSGRVMLVSHQRGWAAGLVCRDCELIMRCPHCTHLLFVEDQGVRLTCPVCHLVASPPRGCPRCHGSNFRPFGWGNDRWQAHLASRYQGFKVVVGHTLADIPQNWQLLVTSPTWQYLPRLTADLVVSIEPERLLGQISFDASERWLRTLVDLRGRADQYLLIETTIPNHSYLRSLHQPLSKTSLIEELRLRRASGFPPYGRLLELSFEAPDVARSERLADRLVHQIEHHFEKPTILRGSPRPLPGHTTAHNQLLVKLPRTSNLPVIAKLRDALPSSVRLHLS